MTRWLSHLAEIADGYDAIVLDQWGVLHDGTSPYPGTVACLNTLKANGARLAVLSNSGKRAAPNLVRIARMGFAPNLFDLVMTSGEALWQDIAQGHVAERRFYPIERQPQDAAQWAMGLDVTLVGRLEDAEAILLMGLPDDEPVTAHDVKMAAALAAGLPVICTNPDHASPRAGGHMVPSPGALAHAHAEAGGEVRLYGKPHLPLFRALEAALGATPERLLMVGDSPEHDIAGGHAARWSTLFVAGGLHQAVFADDPFPITLDRLCAKFGAPHPDFAIQRLQ